MTRKEVVKRAIHFQDPGRIPMFFFNGDLSNSDIYQVVLEDWYMGEKRDLTEWGFYWDKDDNDPAGMGVPRDIFVKEWDQLEDYVKNHAPNPFREDRFKVLEGLDVGDKYLMGSLYLTGFTTMTFIRGFENLLVDMLLEPDEVRKLADVVFGIENDIIRQMPKYGFDAVALYDDWGTQRAMMVSPEVWRDIFKPYYKEQFDLAHSLGMDVFMHTCGDVRPILGDYVDLGLDMLNLGQLDLNGYDNIRENYKGKMCFVQPINYQTTGISGTKEEIYAEAKMIIDMLGGSEGGLIAEIFDYEGMGWNPVDPRNTQYQIDAFIDQI